MNLLTAKVLTSESMDSETNTLTHGEALPRAHEWDLPDHDHPKGMTNPETL